MKRWIAAVTIAVVAVSCAQKKTIEELKLDHDGLNMTLRISPDRANPSLINGKLKVVNSGTSMAQYGNYRLFLDADGRQVVTTVKAKQATAHVDTKPVHLSPGDSLDFFVSWDFGSPVNFSKAVFALHYVDTVGLQSTGVVDNSVQQ
jgi:hypothetical protein